MGWKPWEVRQSPLADFIATLTGWKAANGLGDPHRLSPEEVADIRSWAFD